jgi:hypothetical protein
MLNLKEQEAMIKIKGSGPVVLLQNTVQMKMPAK